MKRAVYIGTEGDQELAAEVLRATIETHSGGGVAVRFLNREMQAAGQRVDNTIASNTPFSKQRVFVPMLAGSGQAAYLDSDMVVFRDIGELFDRATGAIACCQTRQRGREAQTSVIVFEVAKCNWRPQQVIAEIDADPAKYRPYLYEFVFAGGVQRTLPPTWNDLEEYEPGVTSLLHFTDMETQPWLTSANSLADVWVGCLRAAVEAGRIAEQTVITAVKEFQVRPSLLWQMRNGWRATKQIPFMQRLRDVLFFVPPYSLASGIPLGIGRLAARIVKSRAPRAIKSVVLLVGGLVLLARKRRRVLVAATLANKNCVINRYTETVLDDTASAHGVMPERSASEY
jgi:hypothetical protein